MPDWLVQALVGGAIGLLTAVVASWLNKRAFRDEIAESELTSGFLSDAKEVWRTVLDTRVSTEQLIARLDHVKRTSQAPDEQTLLRELNDFYEPESRRILMEVGQIGRHYVSLPSPAVSALREYEEAIFTVLRGQDFKQVREIAKCSERVFDELRSSVSGVVGRHERVADVLAQPVEGGIVPAYVKKAIAYDGLDGTDSSSGDAPSP